MMAFNGFRLDPLILKGVPEDRLYDEWVLWHRALEHVLTATGVDEDRKFSSLMAYGGKELQKVYYSLDSTPTQGPYSEYGMAIQKLECHFKPKHHAIFARHTFWEVKKDPEDTIDELVMKIRTRAELCVFGKTESESLEIAMLDKLLMLMTQDVKEKLLQKPDLNFDEAIKLIKAHDATKAQVRQLGGSSTIAQPFIGVTQVTERQRVECHRCGSKAHLANSDRCPARELKCHKCQKMGHFASKCQNTRKRMRDDRTEDEWRFKKRKWQSETWKIRKLNKVGNIK